RIASWTLLSVNLQRTYQFMASLGSSAIARLITSRASRGGPLRARKRSTNGSKVVHPDASCTESIILTASDARGSNSSQLYSCSRARKISDSARCSENSQRDGARVDALRNASIASL